VRTLAATFTSSGSRTSELRQHREGSAPAANIIRSPGIRSAQHEARTHCAVVESNCRSPPGSSLDGAPCRYGRQQPAPLRKTRRCVIQCFVKSKFAGILRRPQDADSFLRRRSDLSSQPVPLAYGANDDIFAEAALKAQSGNSKSRILICELNIAEIVSGFRNTQLAPRNLKRSPE